jgi:uncharacterized SAM-binding protein YcdF (DUF218 family)
MVYILRLLYAWLLPPGLFILLFLIAFWRFRRTKKQRWLALPLIVMYLLSIDTVADRLIKPLEDYWTQPPASKLQEAQAIVVLGGGACDEAPDFDGTGQISTEADDRFLMGLRLHKALHLPIILSGGPGYERSDTEADIAARTLQACGVMEKYLIKEHRSRNTKENAVYTKEICQQKGYRKALLVTSAYHMPRSVMLFQREGLDIIPYPSGYRTDRQTKMNAFSYTPSSDALRNSAIAMKEYLGILAVKMKLQ